jgi:hypothetical protein
LVHPVSFPPDYEQNAVRNGRIRLSDFELEIRLLHADRKSADLRIGRRVETTAPLLHSALMPRFYIHVRNRLGLVPDEEGIELPDLESARAEAVRSIRSIIGDEAREGLLDLCGEAQLADEAGRILAEVPFSAAFEIHLEEATRS